MPTLFLLAVHLFGAFGLFSAPAPVAGEPPEENDPPPAPPPTPPATPAKDDDDDVAKLKTALEAERKARKAADKQAGELAAWRRTQEDAQKTETERQADRIAELEQQVRDRDAVIAERERNLLKARVAAKYKLPDSLTARLIGEDEAALEADAKALARLVAPPKAPDTETGSRQPIGGLTPNATDDQVRQRLAATGRYSF